MKKILISLACILMLAVSLNAQSKEEKEVTAVVEKMKNAMVDASATDLHEIAADELSYGHSSGTIENKAEFVKAITSGKSDFVTINLTDQTIKIVGNTAIVRHKLSGETNNDGNPGTVNLGILLVWQKQKGKWKLIARQAYKI